MKNVTTKFINAMDDNRNFEYKVTMDFANGVKKILEDPSDLMQTGCEIKTSAETSSFPLGCAIGKTLTLALPNQDDRWSDFDFFGCQIKVELKHPALDTPIVMGYFTVIDPETYGATVEIIAVDRMYKTDKIFNINQISTPISLGSLFNNACSQCGLVARTTSFTNNSYQIRVVPENKTCREIIGMIAMLAGGNAIIDDYGYVNIVTYSMDKIYNGQTNYDGGTFDTQTTPYSDGDNLNGGDFSYSDSGEVSGGSFNDVMNYHVLYKGAKIKLATDDVVISGVQTIINEKTYPTNVTQTQGYILNITNELLEGNKESEINTALVSLMSILVFNDSITSSHTKVTGLRFRIFEIDHVSYPITDFGDPCFVIDRKNRNYKSLITDTIFNFKGFTTIKCTAEAPTRNAQAFSNPELDVLLAAKDLVQTEKSEREIAIQNTQEMIANSPGLYETKTTNIPGISGGLKKCLKFNFDPSCKGESSYDWLSLYVRYFGESNMKAVFERRSLNNLSNSDFIIPYEKEISSIIMFFYADSSNVEWGWKLNSLEITNSSATITPFTPSYYDNSMSNYKNSKYCYDMSDIQSEHNYANNTYTRYVLYPNYLLPPFIEPVYRVLHNKPTMEESSIWWVSSADAMWVSTDGGKTFNASITATGDAIFNRLSAVGISADWIHTGEIVIGGSGTGAKITMKDLLNTVIGGWDSEKLFFKSSDGKASVEITPPSNSSWGFPAIKMSGADGSTTNTLEIIQTGVDSEIIAKNTLRIGSSGTHASEHTQNVDIYATSGITLDAVLGAGSLRVGTIDLNGKVYLNGKLYSTPDNP